ncbi:hypothetical protein NQZ68_032135 [Dissostichus eleginoides]|nr:hypothetical protein NQZ68_032135 [Dissostichus eleginoides]
MDCFHLRIDFTQQSHLILWEAGTVCAATVTQLWMEEPADSEVLHNTVDDWTRQCFILGLCHENFMYSMSSFV